MRACEDAIFWENAVADPSSVFPQLTDYSKHNPERGHRKLMTEEKRTEIKASMKAAVEAGQAMNKKWTWLQ